MEDTTEITNQKLQEKKARDTKKYTELAAFAFVLSFIHLSERERKFYITKVVPLELPKDKRQWDSDHQEVFRFEVNGYVIWLYTAYLADKEQFAENKAIQIVVTKASNPGGKVHYIARFIDSPFQIKNVCFELRFITHQLRHERPVLFGKLADIHYLRKEGKFEWRSTYRDKTRTYVESKDFYNKVPRNYPGLVKYVLDRKDQKMDEAEIRILEKKTPLHKIKRKRVKLVVNRKEQTPTGTIVLDLKSR